MCCGVCGHRDGEELFLVVAADKVFVFVSNAINTRTHFLCNQLTRTSDGEMSKTMGFERRRVSYSSRCLHSVDASPSQAARFSACIRCCNRHCFPPSSVPKGRIVAAHFRPLASLAVCGFPSRRRRFWAYVSCSLRSSTATKKNKL